MTPRPSRDKDPWSTQDELRYLDALGTHTEHAHPVARRLLLRQYLHAPRSTWGSIKREIVLTHAQRLLQEESV